MHHQPVLLKEIIEILQPKENENFVDATFGEGGVSLEIAKFNGPEWKDSCF
jgi:16S rRNA C1402 N4-methylase RsmH